MRCAIYTRKSTDEGLNQDFNSLDAQRESGEAYIRSQAGEGWTLLPELYDDGGYTGANMERPALKRLLDEVRAGGVDCVVVYKVDRLTRSLLDFSRIVEVLDKHGVSFVAVTQQFNTTSSLGRLTLNILLSFAQFEREIISERTRDKQVMARRRGKWTGGHVPLGYDLANKALIVNDTEATRVRQIFEWYIEGHTATGIIAKCADLGWASKQWVTQEGRTFGGHPMRKCHLYQMLANPLYAGRIRAAGELVTAGHEAIIDERTFDLVQAKLKANTRSSGAPRTHKAASLLRGILYCAGCGSAMTPSYACKQNRRYRYYLCPRSSKRNGGTCATKAVPAQSVEEAVIASLGRFALAPAVVQETARTARRRVAGELDRLREELKAVNVRARNAKSQLARMRTPDLVHQTELREKIATGEAAAEELRAAIARGEGIHLDEGAARERLGNFAQIWQAMNGEQQAALLRRLVEGVGYDPRGDKVKITYNSAGIKEFCTKGGSR
ncbi:MAG: recombinase family protein [Bryobacteraceae bacterium]|nr:recombinase family protein [Bryobacteraceae bacterium]